MGERGRVVLLGERGRVVVWRLSSGVLVEQKQREAPECSWHIQIELLVLWYFGLGLGLGLPT